MIKDDLLNANDKFALKKYGYTLEELEEIYENFKKSRTYKIMPTLEFKEDKDENFDELYFCLISGKLRSITELPLLIYKSYVVAGKEKEVIKYFSIVDQDIKTIQLLTMKYLGEYLVKDEERAEFDALANKEKLSAKNANDYLGALVTRRLEERFNGKIYFAFPHQNSTSPLKKTITTWLTTNGLNVLPTSQNMPTIFLSANKNPVADQDFLAEMFIDLVKNYGENLKTILQCDAPRAYNLLNGEIVKRNWNVMLELIESMKDIMTEDTKQREDVQKALESVVFINDKELGKFLKIHTTDKRGEEYDNVTEALNKAIYDNDDRNDKEDLADFICTLYKIRKALSVAKTDKNGETYNFPTNYFKVCTMIPRNCYDSVGRLAKVIGNKTKKIEEDEAYRYSEEGRKKYNHLCVLKDALEEVRVLMRENFDWSWSARASFYTHYNNHDKLNVTKVLSTVYQNNIDRIKSNTGNISNEEIVKIAEETVKYMKEHNLPNQSSCVKTVYKSLIYGHSPLSEEYEKNDQNANKREETGRQFS